MTRCLAYCPTWLRQDFSFVSLPFSPTASGSALHHSPSFPLWTRNKTSSGSREWYFCSSGALIFGEAPPERSKLWHFRGECPRSRGGGGVLCHQNFVSRCPGDKQGFPFHQASDPQSLTVFVAYAATSQPRTNRRTIPRPHTFGMVPTSLFFRTSDRKPLLKTLSTGLNIHVLNMLFCLMLPYWFSSAPITTGHMPLFLSFRGLKKANARVCVDMRCQFLLPGGAHKLNGRV